MELMEEICSNQNLAKAIKAVKSNKGAPGIDKKTVDSLDKYFAEHGEEIKKSLWE